VENVNFGDMSTVDAAALAGNQNDISLPPVPVRVARVGSISPGTIPAAQTPMALTVPVAAIRVAMVREAQDHEHDHQMVAG
jgi:hypothetical protein